MIDLIKFHFNLECKSIKEEGDTFCFSTNGIDFILYPFYRSNEELQDIYQIVEELKSADLPVHTFILNRDGKLITNIYEKNYVLLKIEDDKEKEYNILDIINITNNLHLTKIKSQLYRNRWSELWSEKIDYFEYQVHELGKEKKVILNSFTYYVGLAENAISYVNNSIKRHSNIEPKIALCHKRMQFPNIAKEYFNPLTFIFDLNVRDIAEYIKSAFFQNEEEAWVEFKAFMSIKEFNTFDYEMFYGRLLYPSYYFDIYEHIMNEKEEEETLIPYIKKASAYEEFLNRIYFEIAKILPIEKIEWVGKKIKEEH